MLKKTNITIYYNLVTIYYNAGFVANATSLANAIKIAATNLADELDPNCPIFGPAYNKSCECNQSCRIKSGIKPGIKLLLIIYAINIADHTAIGGPQIISYLSRLQ
jgi:hypothetical protein